MSNLVLKCRDGGDYKPHPEGIHPALCLDVIDLGPVETEFQGQRRMVNKVKLVFESELRMEDGRPFTISKNFTASLHPKAKLAEFLGKWRGRPIAIGESIELAKLIGACCTLVVSHQQNMLGRTYASIDAISKPTRKVAPSGTYDPAAARQRIADWRAKQQATPPVHAAAARTAPQPIPPTARPAVTPYQSPAPKSAAPATAPAADDIPFDPEVGF